MYTMTSDNLNRTIGIAYVGAFAGLAVLYSVIKLIVRFLPLKVTSNHKASRLHFLLSWTKSQLLYAPPFRSRKAKPSTVWHGNVNFGPLPSRLQSLFIFLVVGVNVFLILWKQPYSDPEYPLLSSFNRRLGVVAIANFIPIVATSTIHNPLVFLLDIPYNSFILLHRWLARIATLEIIAHALCHIISVGNKYGWREAGDQLRSIGFFTYGFTATVLLTMLLLISVKPIRSLAYDAFHYIHIAILIATFSLIWLHLSDLPQKWYLLTATVIWAAARTSGLLTTMYRSYGAKKCIAHLEELPHNATRVTIEVPRNWKFEAGQSLNLMIPEIDCSGAHPFSVAWSDRRDVSNSTLPQITDEINNKAFTGDEDTSSSAESNVESKQFLSCIIKEQSGMTRKLNEHARIPTEKGLKKRTYHAVVSGPYGKQHDLSEYSDVFLIAGGVGITHQIPYIRSLLQDRLQNRRTPSRIHLIWVAQSLDVLDWLSTYLQSIEDLRRSTEGDLVLSLFVTRPNGDTLPRKIDGFEIHQGRPDFSQVVGKHMSENHSKKSFVSVCASGGLADDVRQSVRMALNTGVDLDFHEEGFGW